MDENSGKTGCVMACAKCLCFGALFWFATLLITGGPWLAVLIAPSVALMIVARVVFSLNLIGDRTYRRVNLGIIPFCILVLATRFLYISWLDKRYGVDNPEYDRRSMYYVLEKTTEAFLLDEEPTLRVSGAPPVLDGATAFGGLLVATAETLYPPSYPPDAVDVNRTPAAYDRLIRGDCDMIFAFPPSAEQLSDAKAKGVTLRLTPIGREAFVFFVNKRNPVTSLGAAQLQDIYAGETANWRDVGGGDEPIVAFQRARGSGSQSRLERFMKNKPLMQPPGEMILGGMLDIVRQVSDYRNYPNAVGFSFLYYVEEMLKASEIRILAVDGVRPTPETIRNGAYPLLDDICAVTTEASSPMVHEMIDWLLSPQGQRLVRANGYTPVVPVE